MRGSLKSVYELVYAMLPLKGKAVASELVFKFTNKPYVYRSRDLHPPGGLKRGVVCFSIDLELAWAWCYARRLKEDFRTIALREREQVPRILETLDDLEIPATWAAVGHLFLEECHRGANGLAHPEMPRLQPFRSKHWHFTEGDWYQYDPCTNVSKDSAWYGPDLIEKILNARIRHELASHGFSHAGFGSYCSPEVAESELEASLEAMGRFDVRPSTFVFPGNDPGYLETLARKGFTIARTFPINWAEISLPILGKSNIWEVPESAAVDHEEGTWHTTRRLSRLKKYVERAIEERLAAHFWFHPSMQPKELTEVLFPLFEYCAEQRSKGLIDILTMVQLVHETERAINAERVE
jgi:peptidoglycan/xylan/chitin deacetylase (PgdA/CDA1 family)